MRERILCEFFRIRCRPSDCIQSRLQPIVILSAFSVLCICRLARCRLIASICGADNETDGASDEHVYDNCITNAVAAAASCDLASYVVNRQIASLRPRIQGGLKYFTRFNFTKYQSIFNKKFSTVRITQKFPITLLLKIPPHIITL